MRAVLIENTTPANVVDKDQMGGYGIGSSYGGSLRTRLVSSLKRRGRRIPLLTMGYLAALLKKNGHEVTVYNAEDGPPPKADLYVIHSSIVESRDEVALASRLKKIASGAKVGFVGPFCSFYPDLYLEAANFVVRGEPEALFSTIRGPADIPQGIVESPEVKDIETLPFPDWDSFDLPRYGYWPILLNKPFVPILSSRGCSFKCNYCPYIVQYPEWRMRSAENTVEEIRWMVQRHAVKTFLFRDPLFTQGKGRAESIAMGMIEVGLHREVRWACETRTDLLNEDLIDLLYDAGLRGLNVGIESSDLAVLRSANRNQAQSHRERIIAYAERKGIKVAAFYVFGLPADTAKTIEGTIAYAKHLNTFAAQFHINTPFPGTPIFEMYKDVLLETDWARFTSFTPVFRHPNVSARELTRFKERAFGEYYFRPGYWVKHWRHLMRLVL